MKITDEAIAAARAEIRPFVPPNDETLRRALTAALAEQTQQGVEALEIDELVEELLNAQQDINLAANSHMDQSLCDASALIDKVEAFLLRIRSDLVDVPAVESEPVAKDDALIKAALEVEQWWLDRGMFHFDGAPYAIFALRLALSTRKGSAGDGSATGTKGCAE